MCQADGHCISSCHPVKPAANPADSTWQQDARAACLPPELMGPLPGPAAHQDISSSRLLTLQHYLIAAGLCSLPASRAALLRAALHHTMSSFQPSC